MPKATPPWFGEGHSMDSKFFLTAIALSVAAESPIWAQAFDVLIKNGTVYDGTGTAGQQVDLGIRGDRVAALGDFKTAKAKTIIDASGLAVAPGFINMLSWSTESLIQDG